jgi:demethylmenaquinone methyltransferase/2-methoxy-6-polyprenyl-1,4-benzoquinol methylase
VAGIETETTTVARDPAAIVRLYSRVAPAYELWGRLADSRVRTRVRELIRESGGGTVLEVGCGTGAVLADLARDNPGGRTIGIDMAPGMIAAARRRIERDGLANAEAGPGDATRLELEDGSVDALTSSYVLDILPHESILAALREFRRVLRPGGRVVLVNVTPGERRRHRLPELLYGSKLPFTSNCRGIHAAPLLSELGFHPVKRSYVSQLSLPSEVVCATRGPEAAA